MPVPPSTPLPDAGTSAELLAQDESTSIRGQATVLAWLIGIFVGISCCLLCMWWYCRAKEGKGRLVEARSIRLSEDHNASEGSPLRGPNSPASGSLATHPLVTASAASPIAGEHGIRTARSCQQARQSERFSSDWERLVEREGQRKKGMRSAQRAMVDPVQEHSVSAGLVSDTI